MTRACLVNFFYACLITEKISQSLGESQNFCSLNRIESILFVCAPLQQRSIRGVTNLFPSPHTLPFPSPLLRSNELSFPHPTEKPYSFDAFSSLPPLYCFFLPFLRGCSNSGCPMAFEDGLVYYHQEFKTAAIENQGSIHYADQND